MSRAARRPNTGDPSPETILLERAKAGDASAFAELIRLHRERVHSFLLRWLSDRAAVEDILQETILRAFASLKKVDPERPLAPWLFRIAINETRSYLRKRRRALVRESRAWMEATSQLVRLMTSRLRAMSALEVGMAALSENDRKLLLLRFVENLSLEEISQILGTPAILLKMQVHRARNRFRQAAGLTIKEAMN